MHRRKALFIFVELLYNDNKEFPSISKKADTSLGKVFDCSLGDAAAIQATIEELETWLTTVDKSGLPGRFNTWIYQNGILPRVHWTLLVYELTLSTVETTGRTISRYLHRWLDLHCMAGATNSSSVSAALMRSSGFLAQGRHCSIGTLERRQRALWPRMDWKQQSLG